MQLPFLAIKWWNVLLNVVLPYNHHQLSIHQGQLHAHISVVWLNSNLIQSFKNVQQLLRYVLCVIITKTLHTVVTTYFTTAISQWHYHTSKQILTNCQPLQCYQESFHDFFIENFYYTILVIYTTYSTVKVEHTTHKCTLSQLTNIEQGSVSQHALLTVGYLG